MRGLLIVAALGFAFLGHARAETAQFEREENKGPEKKICYYHYDGFSFHYVNAGSHLFPAARCAASIEVPFNARGPGFRLGPAPGPLGDSTWGVLIHNETEVHPSPKKNCFYAVPDRARRSRAAWDGRLYVKTVERDQTCGWSVELRINELDPRELSPSMATLIRDKGKPATNTRLCLYQAEAGERHKFYRAISSESRCEDTIQVP